MGCIAFKFASVWDCKICISKWINVKCLDIEIKACQTIPQILCLYGENERLINSKGLPMKYNQAKDECICPA